MRKILAAVAIVAVAGMTFATSAVAQTTPPPVTAPPVQGDTSPVLLYVDTVQGAAGNPKPAVGCSQTNLFRRGQQVVFRVWGTNNKAGGIALTDKTVMAAYVTIPGLSAPINLTYGAHGKAPNPVVAFWSAAWLTTADTPLGEVDFTVTVITKSVTIKDKALKKGKRTIAPITATFTQQNTASTSRLTITP